MSSLDAKLEKAQFAYRDLNFCLDGRLNKLRDKALAELSAATGRAAATDERKDPDARLSSNPVAAAKKKLDQIEEQMKDLLVTIRFTAVNNGVWQKLIIQNPPRKGNAVDQGLGFNTQTFFDRVCRETGKLVEEIDLDNPDDATLEPISDSQWDKLSESFTAGDWDRVDMTLIELNQRDGQKDVGHFVRASKETRDSEPTSD